MKVIIVDDASGNLVEALVSFLSLQDTPASYTGAGGKVVAVKATEDGLEFIDAPSGGGGGDGVGASLYLYEKLKGVL